jgi:hypothetical protein
MPASAAFVVYRATLAPGLTWAHDGADGGELLAAALTHGVAHPPGYPTYLLLLRSFVAAMGGSPAAAGNLFSALSMSAAILLVALTSARVLRSVHAPASIARLLATATALLIAFAPTVWSQAVITEVYGLHALFVAGLSYLMLCLAEEAELTAWRAAAVGFLLGLGLGNHLSLILLMPGMAIYLWLAHIRLGWRSLAGFMLGCTLGLLVYLYLPWAAASDPPVNWGNPRDLPQMVWMISGKMYQPLVFALPLIWLPGRLSAWVSFLLANLTVPGLALALLGLWRAASDQRGLLGMAAASAGLFSIYALGYDTPDSYVYLIPVYLTLAPALALGAWTVAAEAIRWVTARRPRIYRGVVVLLLIALAALPIYSMGTQWSAQDLSTDSEAAFFGQAALASALPNALIVAASDRPTFALWYYRYGLGQRSDVAIVNPNLYAFDWYRDTIAHWHPEIMPETHSSDFEALVAANIRLRPVYAAEPSIAALTRYPMTAEGILYRLQPDQTETDNP